MTEIDSESNLLIEMVGQLVLVGVIDFDSRDMKQREASIELV